MTFGKNNKYMNLGYTHTHTHSQQTEEGILEGSTEMCRLYQSINTERGRETWFLELHLSTTCQNAFMVTSIYNTFFFL